MASAGPTISSSRHAEPVRHRQHGGGVLKAYDTANDASHRHLPRRADRRHAGEPSRPATLRYDRQRRCDHGARSSTPRTTARQHRPNHRHRRQRRLHRRDQQRPRDRLLARSTVPGQPAQLHAAGSLSRHRRARPTRACRRPTTTSPRGDQGIYLTEDAPTCASSSPTRSSATSGSRSASPLARRGPVPDRARLRPLRREQHAVPGGDSTPRDVPKGQVFAEAGNVVLRVGDDVDDPPEQRDLRRRQHRHLRRLQERRCGRQRPDPGHGTNMILRGRIVADCVVTPTTPSSGDPVGTCTPPRATRLLEADPDLGQHRRRHLPVRRPVRDHRRRVAGVRAHHVRQRRLHHPRLEDARPRQQQRGDGRRRRPRPVDRRRRGPLHRLVPAVDGRPGRAGEAHDPTVAVISGAGHTLTLDGQADTDYYTIYTTGSHGATRNYVINILDTGAPNDGVDELAIYGFDNTTRHFNGYLPGTTTRNPTDDIFLLRAAKCIDTQTPLRVDRRHPERVRSPTETADHPAFVALLHGDNDATADSVATAAGSSRQRAEQLRPADQLRRRAQRPAEGLRPGRQRRLLRRRQHRDHDARRRRRLRHLPDRPDLRHQARQQPQGGAAAAGHVPGADRDDARLAEPGPARAAGRHRRHRQRRVHRLLEPGRAAARGRRRQRPVRRPRVRARRGLRHERGQHRRVQVLPTSTSRPTPTRASTRSNDARRRPAPRREPGLRRRGLDGLPAGQQRRRRLQQGRRPHDRGRDLHDARRPDEVGGRRHPARYRRRARARSSGSASRRPARSTSAPAAARTRSRTTSMPRSRSTAAPASTSSSCWAPSSPTTSSSASRASSAPA